MTGTVMSIRAVGPIASGRLPLSEVARLAGELQATLERLALAILGTSATHGRRPRDVADAVRLELIAFWDGSTVLDMAPPGDAMLNHGLLDESMGLLFGGLRAIAERAQDVPSGFTPQVLDGLIRFSGGISPQTVHRLEVSRDQMPPVVIDQAFRDHVRWLRTFRHHDVVSIVGRLHEGDFDPLALRCRIDTIDTTVQCSFSEDMRERVLSAMDCMVVASGIAELQSNGRVRTLDLDDLTVIDEAQRRTIDQLAQDQGIEPVRDIAEFATLTELEDEEYDRFVKSAMSARS